MSHHLRIGHGRLAKAAGHAMGSVARGVKIANHELGLDRVERAVVKKVEHAAKHVAHDIEKISKHVAHDVKDISEEFAKGLKGGYKHG